MGDREAYVEALKVERARLAQHGRTERVAQVDAELDRYADTPQEPAVETAVPARSRRARKQQG